MNDLRSSAASNSTSGRSSWTAWSMRGLLSLSAFLVFQTQQSLPVEGGEPSAVLSVPNSSFNELTNEPFPLQLEVNGKGFAKKSAGWIISPGQPNQLQVQLKNPESTGPLLLTLTRTQPDGRLQTVESHLNQTAHSATLELGLFAVPIQYEYESGVLYRRGSRFELTLQSSADKSLRITRQWHHDVSSGGVEILAPGAPERVIHHGRSEREFQPLDPPVLLWLAPEVLDNQDQVRVCFQLSRAKSEKSASPSTPTMSGILQITDEKTEKLIESHPVEVQKVTGELKLNVSNWPAGRYRMELKPQVQGTSDHDGPVIVYRRVDVDPSEVAISPVAPWKLTRDPQRDTVVISNFQQAVQKWSRQDLNRKHWEFRKLGPDQIALNSPTQTWNCDPVILHPELTGTYAVFARALSGRCYLRLGREGLVRGVLLKQRTFIDAVDLTGDELAIYATGLAHSGIRDLELIPVTPESVKQLKQALRQPPVPLRGVADWCDYFHPEAYHGIGGRLAEDQLEMVLHGQRELGFSSIGWSIGRSWVEYHSRLPSASRFPCKPLSADQQRYEGRATMIEMTDPLNYVLARREHDEIEILPWLAMQRHYGVNAAGGIFCSDWFRANPQWWRWGKNAAAASDNAVSYYFPEVRRERVDILCEVAERGPNALMVDWCRQVPAILYHPEMVTRYRTETGIDPLKIDAKQEQEYLDWIRWRADFVTETLRELKTRLAPIREQTGKPIPVVVRVPSKGLFYNMAQGLDVETWCREGLIDQIQLDPLEDCQWRGEPHDVRPYLALKKDYPIQIFGGVNGNTFWNYPAVLRRALGLLEAGVDGLEIYESNNFAVSTPRRWLIPVLGDQKRLKDFLENSNLEACYPIWARQAASGYDNHSFRGKWSVEGTTAESL